MQYSGRFELSNGHHHGQRLRGLNGKVILHQSRIKKGSEKCHDEGLQGWIEWPYQSLICYKDSREHQISIESGEMMSPPGTNPTIYDLLATQQLADTTLEQIDKSAKNTFVQGKNVSFWADVITVSRAIKESRQYGSGLPIPELSGMQSVTVADSASGTIKPTGTEIWQLQSINLDNCSAALTDGSGFSGIVLGGPDATINGPLYLTPSLYIVFNNASGSEQTPSISYHKVGL